MVLDVGLNTQSTPPEAAIEEEGVAKLKWVVRPDVHVYACAVRHVAEVAVEEEPVLVGLRCKRKQGNRALNSNGNRLYEWDGLNLQAS